MHRTGPTLLFAAVVASFAAAQDAPFVAPSPGWSEEQIAGVERGPLMPWQRTLEDALALARATGKPLLICVNMDGEMASDSLAYRRYRDPAFVTLASGFIPVLASPDRRNERDFDDRGRRIVDGRFGRLINAEHIDIEPTLFEAYFGGQRVAPRHVGVSADGEVLFDLFLLQDLSVIDRTLTQYGRPEVALPDVTQLDLGGLLATPDAAARDLLEARFVAGDEPARLLLAKAALSAERATQHPALVRLALRDPSPAVRSAGVADLAGCEQLLDLELFPEALRVATRDQLTALAERLAAHAAAATDQVQVRARRLSRIAAALTLESQVVDVELWRAAVAGAPLAGPSKDTSEVVFEALDHVAQRLRTKPDDAALHTLLSELGLRASRLLVAEGGGNPGFALMDAKASAERAVELDPTSAKAWACLASSAHQVGDYDVAIAAAARALPGLLDQAHTLLAAETLNALAYGRLRALYDETSGLGSTEGWPLEWVPDLLAAYDVLVVHPDGTEAQAKAALTAQANLEAFRVQDDFARAALARWPASPELHEQFRRVVLRDGGAASLKSAYGEIGIGASLAPTLRWFEGLADYLAAERDVQDNRRETALTAYGESIDTFRDAMELEPRFSDSSLHYVALAHAGMARIQLDQGLLDAAMASICSGAQAYASAFEAADGLGNAPVQTARDLRRALRRADREDTAAELSSCMTERGVEL